MILEKVNNFAVKSPSQATAFHPYTNVAYGAIKQKLCLSHTTSGRPIWNAHNSSEHLSS
jgi:hypothetical protein